MDRGTEHWTESQWCANAAFHSPYSEANGLPLDIWEQEPQPALTDVFTSNIIIWYIMMRGAVAQWLRHYATNRQVAGSIPDGVIGIFQWHIPADRTMALWSTQPLTEMSTRCISWR
jgi:hypothetical protein